MFKLLIDHANADKEMSGYTLCARMLEGDKTTLIEGAVKLVSEDGLSVLVLTRDERGRFREPRVLNARFCSQAWIEW